MQLKGTHTADLNIGCLIAPVDEVSVSGLMSTLNNAGHKPTVDGALERPAGHEKHGDSDDACGGSYLEKALLYMTKSCTPTLMEGSHASF